MEVAVCPLCGNQFPQDIAACPNDGSALVRQMPDPMIGAMLPRNYRITGRLGRGAMSVVYSGVHEQLNQPVAVKLLKSHLVSDLSTFKRFQQEAKTAGALDHPNIVGILDFGVTDQGVPYLIMELLQGESLSDRLKRVKPVPIQDVISLFSQAADALQYTHERGIIHRDVKPSNILIVEENGMDVVKIVDFGIAKLQTMEGGSHAAAELTATGEVFGTPLYVSPEQAMGRTLDARADIYSLGCVLYEAIAGKPAFSGGTAFDVIRMQISHDPVPIESLRPEIPPSLAMAVAKAMAKDPNERYQSMLGLLHDLNQAKVELTSPTLYQRTPTFGLKTVSVPSSGEIPVISPHRRAALPVIPFLLALISGCLTGCVILFVLDVIDKLEMSNVQQEQGRQMVIAAYDIGKKKHAPEVMSADAAELSRTARTKSQSNDLSGAEADCKKAIAITEKNNQSEGTAILTTELGSIYIAEKKYDDALASGKKALAILQKENGKEVDLAMAYNLVGIAHYYLKNAPAAEQNLLRSYELDKKLDGEASASCIGDLSNLARVYELQKKFDKAERAYRDALSLSEKKYGRDDKRIAVRIENLAQYLQRRHQKQIEARTLQRRASHLKSGK